MNIVNAEQMRAADAHTIHDLAVPSLELMERAAIAVVSVVIKRNVAPKPVLVVCGKGNNGGDGLAAACLLKQAGWDPVVLLVAQASELKPDPAENWNRAKNAGVRCLADPEALLLDQELTGCEMVIDALFGTGLTKALTGLFSTVVQKINREGKEVIAVDLPSGLSADHGEIMGPAIRANVTVALAALKYGHLLSPACKLCGEIYVADIGIPVESVTKIASAHEVRHLLPRRSADSHKGTFGHAVILAGSTGKSGAAYMTGKSALRGGAGLVTVVSPGKVQPVIAALGPEIMTLPVSGHPDCFSPDAITEVLEFISDKDAVALGPGIGTAHETMEFFERIVPEVHCALVIDADGLNLLSRRPDLLTHRKRSSTILTPHPGEMARLLDTDSAAVQKDRIGAARRLAEQTGAVVVLKGYRTVIADPSGNCRINLSGGPSLASAGTGDMLTGFIAGFLAQKLVPAEAAAAGVFLHGLAANLFEVKYPQQALNAMDILTYWNDAVQLLRSGRNLESEYFHVHFQI